MTKTLFTNANIFDGVHNQIYPNAWMLVNDDTGKFIKVGIQDPIPEFDQQINLAGQYVMPGLINCHTHINADYTAFDGGPNANRIETTIRALKNLRSLLKSGVTYIRECGNTYGLDTTLAKLQKAGKLNKVPEIMSSGYAMSMTGGNGDYPHFSFVVDSPDEMRKAVRTNFKNGAQSTKLIVSGGVMSPGDSMDEPQFTSDEIDVAVYETHAKHSIVAAHAEGIAGIKNAIRAGVDSIEHGFYVDDDDIQMMKEKHIYLTPTLISAWCVHYYGGDTLPKWEYNKLNNALEDLFKNIHNAYINGVCITLGTDAGTPYNDFTRTPEEFELMVEKEGFSNFDALVTSRHSAELMQLDDYGVIDADKYADFIVLSDNPLENVRAVQQLDKQVYKHGHREF